MNQDVVKQLITPIPGGYHTATQFRRFGLTTEGARPAQSESPIARTLAWLTRTGDASMPSWSGSLTAYARSVLFGAPISASQWWLWNQIPVTIGNVLSGAIFTDLAFYATYHMKLGPAQEQTTGKEKDSQAVFVQEPSLNTL